MNDKVALELFVEVLDVFLHVAEFFPVFEFWDDVIEEAVGVLVHQIHDVS